MNVKIDLDKVNQNVRELKDVAGELKVIESDLTGVEQRLGVFPQDSMARIRRSVAAKRRQIDYSRRKVDSLGDSLTSIAAAYREAEEDLCGPGGNIWDRIHDWIKDAVGEQDAPPREPTRQEKIDAIIGFEKKHVVDAARFNTFLESGDSDSLTEDDIINIKYIVYSAKEPYRSIYLDQISKYKINTTDSGGGAYYQPWKHKVTYDYPDCFGEDPRGPYTTFFHECGHAVDDLADRSKWVGSDTEKFKSYSDAMGKKVTLREAIEYDVYYNTDNDHSITSIADRVIAEGKLGSNGSTEQVIKAFQSGSPDGLGKDDRLLYMRVKNEYRRVTEGGELYEAVSDVYGGMSGNQLRTGYGHDTEYWDDKNMPGAELWAEYFSYQMTGNEACLDKVREYFPEAVKVMDQYTNSLAAAAKI